MEHKICMDNKYIIMSTLEERSDKYRCEMAYKELNKNLCLSNDAFKIMKQIDDTATCDKFTDFSDVRKKHYDQIENLPNGIHILSNVLPKCFYVHGLNCMETEPMAREIIMKSINANGGMTSLKIHEALRK